MEETTKREIIRLRKGGATYPEISNLVGYGLKSIQKVIGENAPALAKMKIPRISLEKKKLIARDYYGGLTCEEIRKKHKVGWGAVQNIAKEFRQEYGGEKARGRRDNFTDEQIAEIRADYESGLTRRELYNKWAITGEQLFLYGIIQELPKRARLRQLKKK